MSVVFYKAIGASNSFIGSATSILYLPWALKFIWSPLVDFYGTKRKWILVSQTVLGLVTITLVASIFLPAAVYASVVIFMIIAIASATHDIAIDGYYMDVLPPARQAFYVGIRGAAYKVAWLTGSGALVFLAGRIAEKTSLGVQGGWSVAFGVCALLLIACAAFHAAVLPSPQSTSTAVKTGGDNAGVKKAVVPGQSSIGAHALPTLIKAAPQAAAEFRRVLKSWLNQPAIVPIIIYILIFRAGDALMLKMAQPFLLDPRSKGGLGIATSDVGLIYGTVGMLFLLAGGIVGGVLVSRLGLKKCLMPTALIQNGAIVLYWWLAAARPEGPAYLFHFNLTGALNSWLPSASPELVKWFDARYLYTIMCNSAEQFSYGLGTAAYTVFLLKTVKSDYKAAHYAIASALMAFGVMIPGYFSGMIADKLGYEKLFLISFLAAIPGITTIFWLPLDGSRRC